MHSADQIYQYFRDYPHISTDTRKIIPDSLFFALRGETFNGNDYAHEALRKGAVFAVIDDPSLTSDPRCLLVENALQTLQHLARIHRDQFNIPVIAITGTNGKTTTKELTANILATKYPIIATEGNLNNHIGVPLTLLRLTPETRIALIEMGANHPGEIDFLCQITRPGFGLITNIGRAHLEGFGGFEGVMATKTELYRFLANHQGKVFLHQDDRLLTTLAENLEKITYGTSPGDCTGFGITAKPFIALDIAFKPSGSLHLETQLYGQYNVPNILAASCIGNYFEVEIPRMKAALEKYNPGNNRSQVIRTEKNLVVMDAYNANPTSMAAALESFAATDYPRKILILGDMLELGDAADEEHEHILQRIHDSGFDEVFLVGPVFTRVNRERKNICFDDVALAGLWLEHHPPSDSTLLIKGSRGIRLENLLQWL